MGLIKINIEKYILIGILIFFLPTALFSSDFKVSKRKNGKVVIYKKEKINNKKKKISKFKKNTPDHLRKKEVKKKKIHSIPDNKKGLKTIKNFSEELKEEGIDYRKKISTPENNNKEFYMGWDKLTATLAVKQWLRGNSTFLKLPLKSRNKISAHYLKLISHGNENPSKIKEEIINSRFSDKNYKFEDNSRKKSLNYDKQIFNYVTKNYGNEPEKYKIIVPAPVNSRNISFMSPNFQLWLEKGLRQKSAEKNKPLDWSIFPKIRNKYGRLVTPRMFVMAIILIESRGIHKRGNKLYDCQGFYGFMQLGLEYKKSMVDDPQDNINYGIKHLYPCIYKTFVKDKKLRRHESDVDKLLMAAVCYNRGRYSKASKMTWKRLLRKTRPIPFKHKKYFGLHDNRIAVKYGIQLKAYLGFSINRREKRWIRKLLGIKNVNKWCDKRYSNMRNAFLGRAKLSESYGR